MLYREIDGKFYSTHADITAMASEAYTTDINTKRNEVLMMKCQLDQEDSVV